MTVTTAPELLPELPDRVDLAVIGGGPAGATLAALVAEQGHSVLVLEKDQHPRFHIGESLLPHNMKLFRQLGLVEALARIGVRKPGVDFTADEADRIEHQIRFSEALEVPEGCDHAWQVLRSDFDRLLFERAGACGARLLSSGRVVDVDFDSGPDPVLEFRRDEQPARVTARFVVDASGRDCFLARRMGLLQRNREHGTAAIYAHFHDVPRREGDAAGNISIYWFDQGWIWMIPLPDGVMSVGAVCNPDYLRQRGDELPEFLARTIQRNPHAAERMAGARRCTPVTVTGNYSYFSRRIEGPRWLLVGDAGLFIDPVFSSGVYFAMSGAEMASRVVLAELAGDALAARRARRYYRSRVQRGVNEMAWFIYRFPTRAMRRLFLHPRNVLGVKQAVVSLLAGDVYDNPRVRWRLRLFRSIYRVASLADLAATLRQRRQRRHNARVAFDHGL